MIRNPNSNSQLITNCVISISLFFGISVQAQSSNLFQRTVSETEIVSQFHGDPMKSDLNLFMAGNQFVVMDLLVDSFKQQFPQYEEIFYVTIPPGQELNWILKGGIEIHGENSLAPTGFKLSVLPDVYSSVNVGHMNQLNAAGLIDGYQVYAHNRLVFMVLASDPLAGQTLSAMDMYNFLADPTVTLSEPDILTQGIERHFWQMYTDMSKVVFPGDAAIQALSPTMFNPNNLPSDPANSLRRIVYYDKELSGATTLTAIHHLETPAALRSGSARAGAVWITEVNYQQQRLGETDVDRVEIGGVGPDGAALNRSTKVNYIAAQVGRKNKTNGVSVASNKQAALDWLYFLTTEEAQTILESIGFIRATQDELENPVVY